MASFLSRNILRFQVDSLESFCQRPQLPSSYAQIITILAGNGSDVSVVRALLDINTLTQSALLESKCPGGCLPVWEDVS